MQFPAPGQFRWLGACLIAILANVNAGVQLNEIMAQNDEAVFDSTGRAADWVELYNSTDTETDLTGYRLIVDPDYTWIIPTGVTLAARQFLIIWCDNSRPASEHNETDLNCGDALSGKGQTVYLLDPLGQTIDTVTYGFQLVDRALGKIDGQWQLLETPSPGAANGRSAPLGDVSLLRINEWMANPKSGPDWFELYNGDTLPVEMGGCFLTDRDETEQRTQFTIAPLSYIDAREWVLWIADNETNDGLDHVNFKLSSDDSPIILSSPATNLIDRINYGIQSEGVSEGRLPDGTTNLVAFETTATPGEDNYLPLTHILINEVLSHTDLPLEDAIEFYNPNTTNVNISGWFISNRAGNLTKYRIPDGTIIPAQGYYVAYEYQFIGSNRFTLNSAHGDRVYLSTGDAQGNLTGYRAKISFGAAANGFSFGRFITSLGSEFVAQSVLTFGTGVKASDPPDLIHIFRTGQGATNAYPLIGPLVISEIMYHPPAWDDTDTDNSVGEFVELYNLVPHPIPLYDPDYPTNTWKIAGGIRYQFPQNLTMPPGAYWLLVNFNPATNASARAAFLAHYPMASNITLLGPYDGKLQNNDDTIEVYRPDEVQQPPHPDAGFVPYILVEQVAYRDNLPWRPEADGGGASLQRVNPFLFANDPVNWTAGSANPGSGDTDLDGMPDRWENAYELDPHDPDDAHHDADNDGANNLDEYLAGTHPRENQSVMQLKVAPHNASAFVLHFMSYADRSYAIQASSQAVAGTWTNLVTLPAMPTNSWREITVSNPVEPQRYYRITTPQTSQP